VCTTFNRYKYSFSCLPLQHLCLSGRLIKYQSLSKDGSPCNSHEELLSRWTEHYSEALNHPTAVPCPELDGQQSLAVDDPEVSVDAPTLDKVRAAIKKLKFGRAAGRDTIAPEMLK